ncbi:accessory factor UbiK family protein [Facilibium subflavum]|uniref:accessory factor UbiK family protein n=1 Tax=Facilibium subflavum TaxID=2219058 RepID=UPI000E65E2B4|nr:accessory factor UbiK family protein [Facilibium subflavum]
MKIDNKILEDVSKKISDAIPKGVKAFADEFESNCKSILKSSFERLDLVTREEFDIQKEVLLKTRQRLEQLEKKVDKLLKKHNIDL